LQLTATKPVLLPRLALAPGAGEALKVLALVLMTGDHINKYLLGDRAAWLFDAGRVALPLFVMVMAANLARPGAGAAAARVRTMRRLALFGAVASVPFIALGGLLFHWWPLNVMFTLLTLCAVIHFRAKEGLAAVAIAWCVFVVGGAMVEFWWPALVLGLATFAYMRMPSPKSALGVVLSCAALWFINRNSFALLAIPVFILACNVRVEVPRMKWLFYSYYPAHLAVILAIRQFGG